MLSTSGSITGSMNGVVCCTVTLPSDFTDADDKNVIGETFRDPAAEIYYRRLDSLTRSDGARIYAVSLTGNRTVNGKYTITLLKYT